jgi:ABC-type glycerol-3-phosphate transport system permease component
MTLSRLTQRTAFYLIVGLGALLTVIPFAWMILASFKNSTEIFRFPPTFLPDPWRFSNYQKLFAERPFDTWYLNSIIVAGIGTVAVLFFSSLAGFGFAKYNFKGRGLMFALLIGSTMIPFQLILIPLFIETSRMKMIDTYAGLIIPFMAPALGIFLMKQYMSAIPNELLDAARIDGATEFGIFWRVVLPLLRPGLATLGIITFLGSWNSFIWPLVMIRRETMMTLPIGLQSLTENVPGKERDFGMIMAAATLVAVPVIIVFLFLQRQFISGLLSGSVKQ